MRDKNSVGDKIHPETKFSSRKNASKIFLLVKNIVRKICLTFPVRKVSCLGQIDANHHQAVHTYRN